MLCYVIHSFLYSFFQCTFCKCALRVKFSLCNELVQRKLFLSFCTLCKLVGEWKKRNRKHICIWRFLLNIFEKSASKKDQKALKSCRIFSSLSTHLTVRLKLGAALRTLHCKLPLNYRSSSFSPFMFAAAIVLVLLLSLSLVLFSTSVSSSFPPVAIVKVKYLRAAADVIHRRKRQWKGEREKEDWDDQDGHRPPDCD